MSATDSLLALALCESSYSEPSTHQAGACFARLTPFNDIKRLAFRGTNPEYWPDVRSDLDALPVLMGPIGDIHAGFRKNVLEIYELLDVALGDDEWDCQGHSKGGSDAIVFCCYRVKLGRRPPRSLITFGAARCGFEIMSEIRASIPGIDYRNGPDQVPMAPFFMLENSCFRQLGSPSMVLDWIPYHLTSGYKPAVMAALGAPGLQGLALA